jgi:hypothetical protein
MSNPFVLMFIALASVPSGDESKERVFQGPYTLKGEVLDVFQDNTVLLSFGADQGVRKGLKGFLVRGDRTYATYLHCGTVEFMEVGAKYSVARVTFPVFPMYSPYLSFADKKIPPRARDLKAKDAVTWISEERRPLPRLPTEHLRFGGAIIDLTK